MRQPYFRVVVSYHTTDGASYDTELYVPHHYIKLVATGTEKKTNRFPLKPTLSSP